ncbi:MAG: type II toxin-antitoxin system VapC family toxin [Nocardioidaceae bacterium]
MTVVVDASALAFSVLGSSARQRSVRARLTDDVCHSPHLIDAEVGNVLRRHVLRSQLTPRDAETLLRAAPVFIDHRHQMTGRLAEAAWVLQDNVCFYDALYVALAQALSAPLLTGDHRLSRVAGLPCEVQVV